jgi:hypothetical protein
MFQQLEQDEIDKMVGFGTTPSPMPTQNTNIRRDDSVPILRQYQQTYPIQYLGQKEPSYIGVITIVEKWNNKTSQWEFYTSSQKLHHLNGAPVGLY